MPSHIYFRTGDYLSAVTSGLRAADIDKKYLARHPSSSGYRSYADHNLFFLVASASMDGDYKLAERVARGISTSTEEAFVAAPLLVLARYGRWSQLENEAPPDSRWRGATLFWLYTRSCALTELDRVEEAYEVRSNMEVVYEELEPGRAYGTFFNDWRTLYQLMVETLDARRAQALRDSEGAILHWRAAAQIQDQMLFDDLPDWYYPVRESLGAALFRAGRIREAEIAFRDDLLRTPRNPRSLFGLWKTLEAETRSTDADWVKREFEAGWRGGPLRIEDL